MAYDVFISYASGDKPVADAVCARLERADLRCWVAPRDILPGREWATSIVEAIRSVRAFVLVFSSHSNNSHHVRREVELAMQADVLVVPFRVEEVDPQGALLYYIGDAHWLDALTPPMEEHIRRLTESLVSLLGDSPHATESSIAPPTVPPPAVPPPPSDPPLARETRPGLELRGRGRRRVFAGAAVALVVGALVAAGVSFAAGSRSGDAASCTKGVLWQQHRTPYVDETVVSAGAQVGVMAGGAVVGVQSSEEFQAAGLADNRHQTLTTEQYGAIPTEPRDGLVLRERPGSQQRTFYATGGAVFQVTAPETLRGIGVDPVGAATIPAYGLDAAARIPPSGTLLRVNHRHTVWLIQGGARRTASDVCGEANVSVLPASPRILASIPQSAAQG